MLQGERDGDFVYFTANGCDRILSRTLARLFILKTLSSWIWVSGGGHCEEHDLLDLTPRNSVRSRRFGVIYGIYLRGRRVSKTRNHQKLSLPRISGFELRVFRRVRDVSKQHITSTYRDEEKGKKAELVICFYWFLLSYFWTLKM